jgi:hypothetical protein
MKITKEFEKLVSHLKTSAGLDPNTSVGSDSVSKLLVTMIKMTPQIENIGHDFDKILAKSSKICIMQV